MRAERVFKGVDGTTYVPWEFVVDVTGACEAMSAEENILQEADRLTSASGDRPGDYGHPRENLTLTAKLWSPILGVEVTAEQVALCQVQLKIARQCHKPKRDNLTDIAGWARTIERLQEQ